MKKALVIALLVIAAIPLLIGVAELPPHGSLSSPVQTHVSARYLEKGVEEAGTENIVTAVILNYRGLDTSGEVTVIFTALAAVMAVLLPAARTKGAVAEGAEAGAAENVDATGDSADAGTQPLAASVVVSFAVRLLAPFIVLFSAYVMLNGHSSPGGGFQGGAILGGLYVALSVTLGSERVRPLLPESVAPWLRIAAPIAFVSVGVLGVTLTGFFLGFPQGHGVHVVSEAMILAIEIGIGIGGATIFATLFREMKSQ